MNILLHSSKTMRTPTKSGGHSQQPFLLPYALKLREYLKSLTPTEIEQYMVVSEKKARETHELFQSVSSNSPSLPAIDIFLGDIYSGLQAQTFTATDREYANKHLYILSGLYGVLRALDTIQPYRLEMGYKLPDSAKAALDLESTSLYDFWSDSIALCLPKNEPLINLSAKEYTKAIFGYFKHVDGLKGIRVITPKFLTISPKTNEPTFVTVHAKIARGAFAHWLITNRIEAVERLKEFNEIGYKYSDELSTPEEPVFIAQTFKGLGLSIRLT